MIATLNTLVAFLWLLSGIVLYFISDRIYPEERSEPIGPFQIALMLLGPVCWTYLGVTWMILTIARKKDSEYCIDYWTSWMVFAGSLLPWVLFLGILAKV